MKTNTVTISLAELQEALNDYAFKKGTPQPYAVTVVSHSKSIHVELHPGGIVEADEFRHRAGTDD